MPENTHQNTAEYHAQIQREEQQLASKLAGSQTRGAMNEIGRFAITAVVIFVVAFVGLNFSAYAKRISFLIGEPQTSELVASLVDMPVNEEIVEKEKQKKLVFHATAEREEVIEQKTTLPNLDLGVTPPESYIFLPRLNIKAPIKEAAGVDYLGDWTYVEQQIQEALRDGVVRFPGTAEPGERGNAFITGHSSYYPWDSGRYKDIFALLTKVELQDDIVVFHGGKKYIYRVHNIREVDPSETDVLADTDDYRLTLMTCTPLGTALKRLIVTAQLVENNNLIVQK